MSERDDALARIAELEALVAEMDFIRSERDRYKRERDEARAILARVKTSLNESVNDPMEAQ